MMKFSSALLWCLPALALTSAAAIDNRDLASTILGEFESAASCSGCEVRLFQLCNCPCWLSNIGYDPREGPEVSVTCYTYCD